MYARTYGPGARGGLPAGVYNLEERSIAAADWLEVLEVLEMVMVAELLISLLKFMIVLSIHGILALFLVLQCSASKTSNFLHVTELLQVAPGSIFLSR